MIIDTGANEAIRVSHTSDIGLVRRLVGRRCKENGFADSESGRAEIVVQEALRNMIKYGGEGLALVRLRGGVEAPEIEFLAVDSGPGMDPVRALQDGFSTGGSAGQGMGSMARLADDFDVYSHPGSGAVVLCRIRRKNAERQIAAPLAIGAVCTSIDLIEPSGDNFAVSIGPSGITVMVVDGLGHGVYAHEASAVAVAEFQRRQEGALEEILTEADKRMRHTRGGAVSLARCSVDEEKWHATGVGNVSMMIIGAGSSRSALVQSGIVGGGLRRISCLEYPWPPESLFIMFSDGVKSRLSLDAYPGVFRRDPAIIAALLHRDFSRGRDDATVLVVKRPSQQNWRQT